MFQRSWSEGHKLCVSISRQRSANFNQHNMQLQTTKENAVDVQTTEERVGHQLLFMKLKLSYDPKCLQ